MIQTLGALLFIQQAFMNPCYTQKCRQEGWRGLMGEYLSIIILRWWALSKTWTHSHLKSEDSESKYIFQSWSNWCSYLKSTENLRFRKVNLPSERRWNWNSNLFYCNFCLVTELLVGKQRKKCNPVLKVLMVQKEKIHRYNSLGTTQSKWKQSDLYF